MITEDFLTEEHLKNIGEAGLAGAGTGLAYSGTVGSAMAILAEKNVYRIFDLKANLASRTDSASRAEYKLLKDAERLYLKAARAVNNARLIRLLTAHRDEEDKTTGAANTVVDSEDKFSYNIKNGDLYTATKDFIREVPSGDRASFTRSLANKTADMTEGETRVVYIYAPSKIYQFEADGYMHGELLDSYSVSEFRRIKSRQEYKNGIDTDRETSDIWFGSVSDGGKRAGGDVHVFERGRGQISNDRISSDAPNSDGAGY